MLLPQVRRVEPSRVIGIPTHEEHILRILGEASESLFHSEIADRPTEVATRKVSLKHLQRYLNEFEFRFNNRKAPDLFGMTVHRMALAGTMPYAQLVTENAFTSFVRRDK